MDGKKMVAAEEKHLIPLDKVNGYDVRPGFYGINGATALREGVNFTVCSLEATAVELLLYHRGEKEPYAILPFPKHYRIGSVLNSEIQHERNGKDQQKRVENRKF